MKKVILYVTISIIISALITSLLPKKQTGVPKEVYRVYIEGKSLGLIKSKNALEKYIDKEQKSYKRKIWCKKSIYAPDELDIEKELTYDEKIYSTKQIYEKIKDISPFTIDGYTMKIKGLTKTNSDGKKVKGEDKYIYTLNRKTFTKAVEKTVKSFITEDKYNAYKNKTQKEIKETGSIIENLYIKNKITIKESKIPVNKTYSILQEEDLTKYLLFGTTEEQQKYTVKDGDTIADVAFNNKISTEEFLVANTRFKDENSLLFTGQEVTIGLLHPQFDLVEEDHTVSDQEVNYETETKIDNSKKSSYSQVEQRRSKRKKSCNTKNSESKWRNNKRSNNSTKKN